MQSMESSSDTVQAPDNSPYAANVGVGQGSGDSSQGAGVGAAAWTMLAKAGEVLKKSEEAAWRAVRR